MTNETQHIDTVIVGSGFGGSVIAYRLAEAGISVCLLERGRAYPPGSFARSPHGMRENVWDPATGRHGLFDVWSFHDFDAVVASGLGGGSLIYANVLLRKDEHWFVREDPREGAYEYWPVSRAELDPHYDRVERMLRPVPYPFDRSPYDETRKTIAFHDGARKLGMSPFLPPVAITFANDGDEPVPGEPIREDHPNLHGRSRQTCRLCGECDIGCNFGSKNTLDYTYLSAAQRHGADLRTGAEVVAFEPRPGGGFEIAYRQHPVDGSPEPADESSTFRTITADRLILSAGTLGSTRLLLNNRAAFPHISQALGSRFSGNGDLLAFAIGAHDDVDGKRVPRVVEAGHGPVITSSVRVADAADGIDGVNGRGFYLQDAGYPEFVSWMLQLLDAPAAIRKVAGMLFHHRHGTIRSPEIGAALTDLALRDTPLSSALLPLLAMGRDTPDGQMRLRDGALDIKWHKRTSGTYFHQVRDVIEEFAHGLGAHYLDDPLWHIGRVVTVHPLGGCPMGRDIQEGVVDSHGAVFGYPGLYVLDGSMMPGPVGANPSLTIAALADRAADAIIAGGSPREATG